MKGLEKDNSRRVEFFQIKLGKVRQKSNENDPEASYREWIDKDKKKHEVHERVYSSISGYITKVATKIGEFGEQFHFHFDWLDENEPLLIVSLPSGDKYLRDILKKLPNIDFSQPVTFKPFSFEDKTTKKIKEGVSISQNPDDPKDLIQSYFYDSNRKCNLYGYPEMTEQNPTNEDWKIYFLQEMKFLRNSVAELVIPKIEEAVIGGDNKYSYQHDAGKTPIVENNVLNTNEIQYPDEEQELPF